MRHNMTLSSMNMLTLYSSQKFSLSSLFFFQITQGQQKTFRRRQFSGLGYGNRLTGFNVHSMCILFSGSLLPSLFLQDKAPLSETGAKLSLNCHSSLIACRMRKTLYQDLSV